MLFYSKAQLISLNYGKNTKRKHKTIFKSKKGGKISNPSEAGKG
jgi:hypothetical protein